MWSFRGNTPLSEIIDGTKSLNVKQDQTGNNRKLSFLHYPSLFHLPSSSSDPQSSASWQIMWIPLAKKWKKRSCALFPVLRVSLIKCIPGRVSGYDEGLLNSFRMHLMSWCVVVPLRTFLSLHSRTHLQIPNGLKTMNTWRNLWTQQVLSSPFSFSFFFSFWFFCLIFLFSIKYFFNVVF